MKNLSIYIHIPFCRSKCHYCDFYSTSKEDGRVEKYIDSLCQEILNSADILTNYNIDTIYFGGGTPSYIDSKYIQRIMSILNLFGGSKSEITIEVNPKDCIKEKLQDLISCGFNRFSIGLQTIHNNILKDIGRNQTIEDFTNAYTTLEELGVGNISVDCIAGLPGDTIEGFAETLEYITSLGESLKHISVYSLEVHEGTRIDFLLKEGFLKLPDENLERDMKHLADKVLEEKGYPMYEISNYSKPGYESKHNNCYWLGQNYLGFGAAASSYILGSRYTNISDIDKYISNTKKGISNAEDIEDMSEEDILKEWVMLRFRLKSGVSIEEFKQKFKKNLTDIFKTELEELTKKGLIEQDKDRYVLTAIGRDLANLVFEKFV